MIHCLPDFEVIPELPLSPQIHCYQLRVVGSWQDLHEKVVIFDNDLDDRLMELYKVGPLKELTGPIEPRFAGLSRRDPKAEKRWTFSVQNGVEPAAMELTARHFGEFAETTAPGLPTLESIAGKWLRVEGSTVDEING